MNWLNLIGFIRQATNKCVITLSCEGETVTFPIAPEAVENETSYHNSTLNINGIGEINMRGKRALESLKFSAFFPFDSFTNPYSNIEKLKRFANSTQPCKLNVGGMRISYYCTIDGLSYGERDCTGDVYFNISLKEYRFIDIESQKADKTTGLIGRINDTVNKVATVVAGMDSMDMALRLNPENAMQLYSQIEKNPKVEQGSKLTVVGGDVHCE